uniref:VIT family protein n=1 Tax=viral metagenome TaxID=1070528 RepID=A0A6C0LZY7_9ZZZZ
MVDVPSIVYGGTDGIITTFAVAVGSYSAGFDRRVPILLGFANLLADATSMASASYLAEKTRGGKYPIRIALTTFSAFVLLGSLPLLPYLLMPHAANATSVILVSFAMTLVGLAIVGYIRSTPKHNSIAETIGIGIATGIVAYGVVYVLKRYE